MQVNGRTLLARTTGVQRYAHEVISRLPVRLTQPVEVITPRSPKSGVVGHAWEQLILPRRLAAGALLWSPGNTGPLSVPNQVVTVHDAAVFDHPEWFSSSFARAYHMIVPRLMARARRIITVSRFSADRLIARFGLPAAKFVIIHNGVDLPGNAHGHDADTATAPAVPIPDITLPARYCLYVGSLEPRKNLHLLLYAWERVAAAHPDVSLVIAGAAGRVFRDIGAVPDKLPRVVTPGYVPDEALPGLMAGAELFVYPSLYEGFGLPPLEAMSMGTPAIVSDIPAHREACGDAAWFVDPHDETALADQMINALAGSAAGERASRSAAGRARAAEFSWDRSADRHAELFAELM